MPRDRNSATIPAEYLATLTATGEGALTPEQKLALVYSLRRQSEGHSAEMDRFFIQTLDQAHASLREAKTNLDQTRVLLEELTAAPWYPATYLGPVATGDQARVVVAHGNTRRLVGLTDGVSTDSLRKGDEVYLGNQLNVVMAKSPYGPTPWGDVGILERKTEDGRLELNVRGDEKVIVDAADTLAATDLQPGDLIRWQRESWMAFEKLPRVEGSQFLLEDVPDIERDRIGGQDANLELLLWALTATLVAPAEARRYGIDGVQRVLMFGPPGCGKTLMAKIVAAQIRRISGKRCRFAVVKPGEWEDPFVGVTQRKIRETFAALSRAAEDGIVILFLDEIESIGQIRGGFTNPHGDKFLAALLTEMDGFTANPNVAVLSATNRKDLIDPALLERLGQIEISVGRPDMRGARSIFDIHLAASLPYNANGKSAADTRDEMIEAAVSRLYYPNSGNEVCRLRFRDGKVRTVAARELGSGRSFEQVCHAARLSAFRRSVEGGEKGLCVADIDAAVSDMIEKMSTTLTPRNAHAYLADLPQDVDVVSAEPVTRRVSRPRQYLSVA